MLPMDAASERVRRTVIDLRNRRIRLAKFRGSEQEQDLRVPCNCSGYGRIHHFCRQPGERWPPDPLPMDPASKALGLPRMDVLKVQVFQCSGCNHRCWYCFVPSSLLSISPESSGWFTTDQMLDLYLEQQEPPRVIDLTGGEPGLVPEWVPWMMRALQERRLESSVYLWSDDNLSTDYLWTKLTDQDWELLRSYPTYGKVVCLKGFSEESFAFNTGVDADLFGRQLSILQRALTIGVDLYAYVTLTTPTVCGLDEELRRFVDLLQALDVNLPLRTVPLQIKAFTPTRTRLTPTRERAMKNQFVVADVWTNELTKRFSSEILGANIADIPLATRS